MSADGESWKVQRYVVDRNGAEVASTARGDLTERWRIVADSDSGMVIADMVAGGPKCAAHIVKCVALHDELVGALRDALAAMEHMGDVLNEMDAVDDAEDGKHFAAFARARAVLSKAEGKP
jgi:hypothetical protein